MKKIILVISLMANLTACNWVQLTSAGEQVQLRSTAQVQACERLGTTTAETLDKILLVERGSNKLQDELTKLARNEAGDMGGNAIVPDTVVTEGVQRFMVFRC